jgi:hypothetical protein
MDGKPTNESVTDAAETDSGLGPGAEKLADEIEPVQEDRNGDGAKPVTLELTREDGDTKAEGPILADPSFPVSSKPVRARRWSKLEDIDRELQGHREHYRDARRRHHSRRAQSAAPATMRETARPCPRRRMARILASSS